MRTCKEVSALLSEAQERPLDHAERWAVTLHLLICRGCSNFRKQLRFLRTAVHRYRDSEDGR